MGRNTVSIIDGLLKLLLETNLGFNNKNSNKI